MGERIRKDFEHGHDDGDVVKSIIKGFQILGLFTYSDAHLTFSDIKKRTKMPNGSLYRFLTTMTMLDVLEFDPVSKRYSLGYRLILFGDIASRSADLVNVALPYMERIKSRINETVSLFVRRGHKKVCLHRIESDLAVRYISLVGEASHLHSGASGKVLMAGMTREEIDELERVEGFPAITANTLTTRESIEAVLEQVRQCGYAISYAERNASSAGIGRPIFGKDGTVVACLNITLPSERYNEEKIPLWLELLGESTLEISKRLGYEGVAEKQARPIV